MIALDNTLWSGKVGSSSSFHFRLITFLSLKKLFDHLVDIIHIFVLRNSLKK